jgi:hypothetical protein
MMAAQLIDISPRAIGPAPDCQRISTRFEDAALSQIA